MSATHSCTGRLLHRHGPERQRLPVDPEMPTPPTCHTHPARLPWPRCARTASIAPGATSKPVQETQPTSGRSLAATAAILVDTVVGCAGIPARPHAALEGARRSILRGAAVVLAGGGGARVVGDARELSCSSGSASGAVRSRSAPWCLWLGRRVLGARGRREASRAQRANSVRARSGSKRCTFTTG